MDREERVKGSAAAPRTVIEVVRCAFRSGLGHFTSFESAQNMYQVSLKQHIIPGHVTARFTFGMWLI